MVTEAKDLISQYKSQMYDGAPSILRTGDVVRLSPEDFRKFVRYESILPLIDDYSGNPDYAAHLWAVLNKPCDMVHDESRQFKNNLFLAPLQGFRSTMIKGPFRHFRHIPEKQPPQKAFLDLYRKYLAERARSEIAELEGEKPGEYSRRINQEYIDPIIGPLKEQMDSIDDPSEDPDNFMSYLKAFLEEQESLLSDVASFEDTPPWQKTRDQYAKLAKDKSKILFKNSEAQEFSNLCLNQYDSKGVFFYEPHPAISSKDTDLTFIIQLEDMITVKVKDEAQKEGELVQLLSQNRLVSLTENFSDRLLNIMGNFFSKIGTNDVSSKPILSMYQNIYPDSFSIHIKQKSNSPS